MGECTVSYECGMVDVRRRQSRVLFEYHPPIYYDHFIIMYMEGGGAGM